MTNEQINRIIAEELGWTNIRPRYAFGPALLGIEPKYQQECRVPDFCNDYNAVAEMRKWISGACECQFFMEQLRAMVHACHMTFAWEEDWLLVAATPRQQAEAFLRMRGKWREG